MPSAGAPSAAAHTSQAPPHAELQHTPSAHDPLAHCVPALHAWPLRSLHAPVASQVLVATGQLSASSAFVTGEHVPGVAPLHAWQAPHDPLSQHTPSTQKPVSHCVPLVHAPPCVCRSHVSPNVPPPPKSTVRCRTGSNATPSCERGTGVAPPVSGVHVAPS